MKYTLIFVLFHSWVFSYGQNFEFSVDEYGLTTFSTKPRIIECQILNEQYTKKGFSIQLTKDLEKSKIIRRGGFYYRIKPTIELYSNDSNVWRVYAKTEMFIRDTLTKKRILQNRDSIINRLINDDTLCHSIHLTLHKVLNYYLKNEFKIPYHNFNELEEVSNIYVYSTFNESSNTNRLDLNDTTLHLDSRSIYLKKLMKKDISKLNEHLSSSWNRLSSYHEDCFMENYELILTDSNNNYLGVIHFVLHPESCGSIYSIKYKGNLDVGWLNDCSDQILQIVN